MVIQDKKVVSLRDLASILDVTPSTVSRALAGENGVGAKKAKEIRELAERYNYQPKPLRRKYTKALALLMANTFKHENEPDNLYLYMLVCEVVRVAAAIGWHVHMELVDTRDEDCAMPKVLLENRVDGALLIGFHRPEFCKKLRERGIPAVAMDDLQSRLGITCISASADLVRTAEVIVDRLVSMNHSRIAFVFTELGCPNVLARIEGYRNAMKRHGFYEKDKYEVKVAQSTLQQSMVAVRRLLALEKPPTAILFLNDLMAVGGMLALAQNGLRVPEDMSVVGHDNTALGRDCDPPISSVDMNTQYTIERAMKLLQEELTERGKAIKPTQETVSAKVIWRGSCGPAPLKI